MDEKEKGMIKLPSRKFIAAISVLLTLLLNNLIMTAGTKTYATNDGSVRTPTRTEELPEDPARTGVEPRSESLNVGEYASLALTSRNLPVISYSDYTNDDLKLAVCTDAACTSPTISTLDRTGRVGVDNSLALTSNNLPVISYHDYTNNDLKLAVCNNAACTSPTISTIDSRGWVGIESSIALTSSNLPVISYSNYSSDDLKLAVCNNPACTSPTISTLDSTGNVGWDSSIALTSSNLPVISYADGSNGDLKLAVCSNTACTSPIISIIDSIGYVGYYSSLALTSSNLPVISYFDSTNGDLKLAVCNDAACTSPAISTLDSIGRVGSYSSLALTSSNVPVISYYDHTNDDLKLAVCTDAACTSPTISTLNSLEYVGWETSLALTTSDFPVFSFYDSGNGNLMLYPALVIVDEGKPNSFAKSTPTNNATVTSTSAILTWSSAINIESYEYCIATSTAACTTWTSTGTRTTATKSGLAHNTTYYWRVRANNPAGTTYANSMSFGQFTVVLPPAAFNKTSPANNATNQPTTVTLTWAASTRATSYEYCIALTQAACTNWKSTGTKSTVAVSGLAKAKSYFWQVRAKNAGGTTISSAGYRKFTTQK